MSHDAFISYSNLDRTVADAAVAVLESRGIRCWIAPRDITPGLDWSEAIVDAIERSKVMVLVLSAHANGSPQIKREVERAVNRGIRSSRSASRTCRSRRRSSTSSARRIGSTR